MATAPFTIDTTVPDSLDTLSQWPTQIHGLLDVIKSWLNTFSDPTDGSLRLAAFDGLLGTANEWTEDQTFDGAASITGNVTIGGTLAVTGAVTLTVPLAIGQGGTGATSQSAARTALGLGTIAVLASPLPVANGGTASTTAADARTALGLGSLATQASSSVTITGGSISGITDLAIADGGTGSSTAAAARTALFGVSTTTDNAVAKYNGTTGSIQNSGVTVSDTNVLSAADVTYTSDIRQKSSITPITHALDKVQQLSGYFYHRDDLGIDSAGVIAQEVEAVFPEAVQTDPDGFKTVSPGPLLGLLVAAIKELANGASL